MAVKKPNSRRNLDMALHRICSDDADFVRTRTFLATAIVGQSVPHAVIKGGSALRIRFGEYGTRATTDLDAARNENLESFANEFAARLQLGWEGFTGRLVTRRPASPANVPAVYVMQPFDVKLDYLGRPWCTVTFELGHDEIGDADHPEYVQSAEAVHLLQQLGFPSPGPIPLMPLPYQIAQKLHGVSEPSSHRAHDLIDLQLIVRNSPLDLEATAEICRRLFSYRQAQTWPPHIVEQEDWAAIYTEQSRGLDVLSDVSSAVAWANELILQIDQY